MLNKNSFLHIVHRVDRVSVLMRFAGIHSSDKYNLVGEVAICHKASLKAHYRGEHMRHRQRHLVEFIRRERFSLKFR